MTSYTTIIPKKLNQLPSNDGHLSYDLASMPHLLSEVIVGVDTHKDCHVAAVITRTGQELGTQSFPATTQGHNSLLAWSLNLGVITKFGIEGTGSYGKALTTFLRTAGYRITEVNRGNRQTRRQYGKTDTIDAITAARSVLAGTATAIAKNYDGSAEMIRQLQIVRDNIVKNTTEITNIFHDMIMSAPEDIQQELAGKTTLQQARICASFMINTLHVIGDSTRYTLQLLAQRWLTNRAEATDLGNKIHTLIKGTQPELLEEFGIGPETAATILIAVGENIERIHSEAALAHLAGIAPIPASSGKTCRYRLNRGGNRKLNTAIYRIAITRMKSHEETRKYVAKRTAEGKSKREIIRILKRYIIRHIYKKLQQTPPPA